MRFTTLLRRLEDFRLPPFFGIISVALGVSLGKYLGISQLEVLPPIEAIKQIPKVEPLLIKGSRLAKVSP